MDANGMIKDDEVIMTQKGQNIEETKQKRQNKKGHI